MDSGNTKMKHKSSLLFSKGRFLMLFLLLAGFQSLQAIGEKEETYIETETEAKIVISEETTTVGLENLSNAPIKTKEACSETRQDVIMVISKGVTMVGLENLHIIHSETKESQNQPKKLEKILIVKKPDSQKAVNKASKTKQNLKSAYTFSNHSNSDTHLNTSVFKLSAFGSTSFNFKYIATNEVWILNLLLLIISIFIINFYKSRLFSGCYFLQNFQRPPPKFFL